MPVAVKVLKSEGLTDALRAGSSSRRPTRWPRSATTPTSSRSSASGTSDDGRPYLVMKYYPPPNLAMRARAERFTVEEVLRTGIQLASAVETAHRAAHHPPRHQAGQRARQRVRRARASPTSASPAGARATARRRRPRPPTTSASRCRGRRRRCSTARATATSAPTSTPSPPRCGSCSSGRSPVRGARRRQLGVCADAADPQHRRRRRPAGPDVPAGPRAPARARRWPRTPAHRPATALELARALQAVEQQQRLARTPIVVLDEQGHTTLVSQTQGSRRGPRPGTTTAPGSRPRRPCIAQPVAPVPVVDAAPGDGRDGPTPSAPSAPGRGAVAGADAARRSVAPVGAGASRRSDRPSPRAADTRAPRPDGSEDSRATATAPTIRRPGAQAAAQPSPADADSARERRSPRSRRRCSWGARRRASSVLLGVVAFLLLRPEDSGQSRPRARRRAPPSRCPPTQRRARRLFDEAGRRRPLRQRLVTFTWTYPEPPRATPSGVSSAPRRPTPRTPDDARERVRGARPCSRKVPTGSPVCAVVIACRAGQSSPGSEPECETAQ